MVQAGDGVSRRRFGLAAEAERQYEVSLRSEQFDLTNHGHVAVLGEVVFPRHPLVRLQILPAIGRPDVANRALRPGHGARERERIALAPCKEQRGTLEIAHPGRVATALIAKMRRQQDMHAIVGQDALLRGESDLLQYGVAMGIGQGLLLDAVTTVPADVDQLERRDALGEPVNAGVGVTLLLRKERRAVRDEQPHVAYAGLVDARIIDLVENAVAEREPNVTVGAERRAHADLGARGPSRCGAGGPRGETG